MKKLPLLLSSLVLILLIAVIGILFYNKQQETQLEKERIKLEMEKLKSENNEKKISDKTKKTDTEKIDTVEPEKEKTSDIEENIKESVLSSSGSWNGDSSNLGFDVHSPSASRTAILKSPDATYYVMPEEYEQAKVLLYNLYALDENGNDDCENVNSKCYNDQHKNDTSNSPE